MVAQKVFRKESKRWVAPKTSYDGDDWGNDEFEEEEPNEEHDSVIQEADAGADLESSAREHEKQSKLATSNLTSVSEEAGLPTHQNQVNAREGELTTTKPDISEVIEPELLENEGSKGGSAPVESVKPSKNQTSGKLLPGAHQSPSVNVEESSNEPQRGETPEQGDQDDESSIQDIYGFYENRYSSHPYSAMLNEPQGHGASNEFSDSTASLSTGIYSVDSGAQDNHRSERRASNEYQTELDKVPESPREIEQISTGNSEDLNKEITHLNIRKGHSRDSSGATTTSSSTQQNLNISNNDRPGSQVVDSDIAELYQGSSEFLNRPISTYNPEYPHDFSDQSIKDLLTPRLEQNEFEVPESSDKSNLPSFSITSASPNADRSSEYETSATAPETEPSRDSVAASTSSAPKDYTLDHEYADKQSGFEGSSSTDDQLAQDDSSEDDVASLTDSAAKTVNTSTKSLDMPVDPAEDQPASEHFILPSERNRLQGNKHITTFSTTLDDDTAETRSKSSHQHNSSASSNATGVTSSSNPTDIAEDDTRSLNRNEAVNTAQISSASLASEFIPDYGLEPKEPRKEQESLSSSTRGPQSIASKVKRPPQVDFSSLLNKSGTSSETRCEQMRILRAREAEYSSGLETWLMATLEQADKGMKIFVDGVPPAAAEGSTALDLPTTAKVSNVMHSSATNTKEKLGKVSEKSKSFFAKVIR